MSKFVLLIACCLLIGYCQLLIRLFNLLLTGMKILFSTYNNNMKKFLSLLTCTLFMIALFAKETKIPTVDLSNRSNDHLLVQLGSTHWSGIPDSIQTKGFSKSFNVYLMFDFPLKTNPKLSMAFGPGIASDHILFSATNVGIKDNA